MTRNNFSKSEAQSRIASQMPLEAKKRMATHDLCLIDNSGSIDNTRAQVMKLKRYLDTSWRTEVIRAVLLFIPILMFGVSCFTIDRQ